MSAAQLEFVRLRLNTALHALARGDLEIPPLALEQARDAMSDALAESRPLEPIQEHIGQAIHKLPHAPDAASVEIELAVRILEGPNS